MTGALRQLLTNPYTDLALERAIAAPQRDGLQIEQEQGEGFTLTRVLVTDETGAAQVGKPPGAYITIEAPGLLHRDRTLQSTVAEQVANALASLLPDDPHAPVLVVGMGNRRATPDALGPRTVQDVLVTRHLDDYVPEDLKGRLRPVCAIAPGVLGTTGLETSAIVKGIVEQLQPAAVIAIDALAAQSVERLLTTIQLTDTGISPGGGVGNRRRALNAETLGVPVIAVGVPTVVHAMTITVLAVEGFLQQAQTHPRLTGPLADIRDDQRRQWLADALPERMAGLMVTPKEIDAQIEQMAECLAAGINRCLHPGIIDTDLADALA